MLCCSLPSLSLSDRFGSAWTTHLHCLLHEGAPLGWAPCCPAAGGEMLVLIQPPQLARGEAERSMGTQQSREALFLISPASSEKKEQLFTVLPAHLPRTIKLGNGFGTILQCTQPCTFPLHLLPLPLLAEIAVSGDEIQLTQQCRQAHPLQQRDPSLPHPHPQSSMSVF